MRAGDHRKLGGGRRGPSSAPLLAAARHESLASHHGAIAIYAVVLALVCVLLAFAGPVRWGEAGPALGLQALVGVLLLVGPSLARPWDNVASGAGVAMYLLSVALLRYGAGAQSGFGPLMLLPVTWSALRTRRTEFALGVVGIAVVYIVPALVIGPPRYPDGTWRSGVLLTVAAAVLGLDEIRLVDRVRSLLRQREQLARTDELTGLANRRAWKEALDHEVGLAARTGLPLTVALIDLDSFKQYNDAHGHLAGDRMLTSAAERWRTCLRNTDVLARWGGDEFGLVLPGCDQLGAERLSARMLDACPELPFSFGVSAWEGERDSERLVGRADDALYRAKAKCAPAAPDLQPSRA